MGGVGFWIVTGLFVIRLIWKAMSVKEEKLIVIRELGVHINTRYWSGKETSLFIEKERIKAVVINEGIRLYNVITYMAFIVKDEDRLICAFENIFPRMDVILSMYRE